MRKLLIFFCLSLAALQASAETIIHPDNVGVTENGLFMSNGRYFVAGMEGIFEVKRTPDSSSKCEFDFSKGLTYCKLLDKNLNGDTCAYTGMTTRGNYLYAACTVPYDGLLGGVLPPKKAALIRLQPGISGGSLTSKKVTYFAQPVWYNGMTMLDDRTILMTPTGLLDPSLPAIAKLTIDNPSTFQFHVEDWLDSSLVYFFPNGLAIDNGYLYFVGGQNLSRVRIVNGSPGFPVLIYAVPPNKVLDDLVIKGDWIAVAEWGLLATNSITLVHKTGLFYPRKIYTGSTQLSSVAVDPGTLFNAGDFIATSFNQGGVYRFK